MLFSFSSTNKRFVSLSFHIHRDRGFVRQSAGLHDRAKSGDRWAPAERHKERERENILLNLETYFLKRGAAAKKESVDENMDS